LTYFLEVFVQNMLSRQCYLVSTIIFGFRNKYNRHSLLKARFLLSDRGNIIETSGTDFVESLPLSPCLLAFQRFNEEDWGIVSDPISPYHIRFPPEDSSSEPQGSDFKVSYPSNPYWPNYAYFEKTTQIFPFRCLNTAGTVDGSMSNHTGLK